MHLRINIKISRKLLTVVSILLILMVVAATLYLKQNAKTPLPSDIKNHVSFKVIYPASDRTKVDTNSFVYQAKDKTLSFNVSYNGAKVIFAEQKAPDELGSDTQAYYPALGIHPYAQFKTDLGQVALTKFWQTGNFKPIGQSAVLASRGTFVIAHSDKDLTNQQWKSLFESVKVK